MLKQEKMRLLGCALFLLALQGCASAPDRASITAAHSQAPTEETALMQVSHMLATRAGARPDDSGAHVLGQGTQAYAARLALIAMAEQTLDVQYYLYHQDATGILMSGYLWDAAERGVKIRLLLDDMENRPDDYPLTVLDAHPNIEVRLYNPFYRRSLRSLQLAGSFGRLNHRMHNKSLTADNAATVVGGRNVGDEYFGANQRVNFGDMDVLAFGPVVQSVSGQFDEYWNSELVYPLALLNGAAPTEDERHLAGQQLEQSIAELEGSEYSNALVSSGIGEAIRDGSLAVTWAPMQVWYDKPDLVAMEERVHDGSFVIDRLFGLFGEATGELFLISPYFVPRKTGTELLTRKANSGVKVTVVTNALAATDVVAVHSGYAKSRKDLLQSDVTVYEIKAAPNVDPKAWSLSSTSSLHAKTFVVDRRWVFIGSFNLDPRSSWLNTEMGILIDSPALAGQLLHGAQDLLQQVAYQVTLQEGDLLWTDLYNDEIYDKEPNAGWWRRFMAGFIRFIPMDSQL